VRVSAGAIYTANFTPSGRLSAGPATRGLWKFDGNVAQDSSGNGNHGALYGGASYSEDVPAMNEPPSVTITAPSNGATFAYGSGITINAAASDTDGVISKVEFFQGGTKLGEDTTAPYSFTWGGVPAGSYTLTAVATDNAGATMTSAPVSVTVNPNNAPQVSLTAPANNSTFGAGAGVQMSANAADADGSVVKVEFFQGETKLGEDTTAPYEFVWTNVPTGSYALSARATDNGGLTATSSQVNVTVALPVVHVNAIDASASEQGQDPGVFSIVRDGGTSEPLTVHYSVSGTATGGADYAALVGSVTIPAGAHPQTVTVTPVDDALVEGEETVTLTLSANAAYTTGSPASATITISDNDTHPPTTSITTPSSGAVFVAPATIFIEATASDPDGSVTKVEFFQGGTKLGEDTTAPYNFTWGNAPAGSYTLTTVATDNAGAAGTSLPVNVTVNPNSAPQIGITTPSSGAVFIAPASITISATASDADGSVTKVEFFQGSTKLGEAASAPYSFTWGGVPAGSYTLTAVATDNAGATTTCAPVGVTVNPNNAPQVSLTAPANNSTFGAGASVQMSANAADADGSVAKVEFFQGQTKLGEDTSAPYEFVWTNVPAGSYTLSARATDNGGLTATSAPVNINVSGSGDFALARLEPANRTGAAGVDPASRNYNWGIPLVSLPGRAGLDLGISLSYNSLVWTRAGNVIFFDGDLGTPSPGFRLGFPVIQKFHNVQAGKDYYILITPSGARVELRHTGAADIFEAIDSSFLHLTVEANGGLTLRSTDGTQMSFVAAGGEYRCTEVRDSNGNYTTINHNQQGDVQTIVDTLGRTITFNYEAGALKSITQPWNRGTETGAVAETYTWAEFHYENKPLNGAFAAGIVPYVSATHAGGSFRALTKVVTGDGSYFTFGYNPWGQVNRIGRHAANHDLLNYVSYNLPVTHTEAQSDCPRFNEQRVWAAYWNGDTNGLPAASEEAVTLYSPYNFAVGVSAVITPDGTLHREFYATSGRNKGLTVRTETFSGGPPQQLDDPQYLQKWTVIEWGQENQSVDYPLNPRVGETNVYDKVGNRKRTRITYKAYNLPEEVFEYGANAGTVLRRTHITYRADTITPGTAYTDRRIIGLPEGRKVYGQEGWQEKLFSKVTYEYDLSAGGFLAGAGTVTQHRGDLYGAGFHARGNLNRTRRWNVESPDDATKSVTYETGYNTTGSVVFTRDPLGRQTNISYAGPSGAGALAYPTKVTDPDDYFSQTEYNYGMGLVTRVMDPKGAAVKTFYDSRGRRRKVTSEVNNAYTRWEYGENGRLVRQYTIADEGKPETSSLSVSDGAGRVIGTLSDLPASDGGYAAQKFEYDLMGRSLKRSNPIEVTAEANNPTNLAAWQPSGDDSHAAGGTGWVYTSQTYDWQGRPLVTTNVDGTTKEAEYGGCGCAGGVVVTVKGEQLTEGRRKQKVYQDVFGRTVKTEVLNWDGSVYSTVVTEYDALDRVKNVKHHEGGTGGTYLETTMAYDGHGRLSTRHTPEQDQGKETMFEYNRDDTVKSMTDARGVKTAYTYNGRKLVESITYSVPEGVTGIPGVAPVTFTYDEAGNRLSMTDGEGAADYVYDQMSRMISETRQINFPGPAPSPSPSPSPTPEPTPDPEPTPEPTPCRPFDDCIYLNPANTVSRSYTISYEYALNGQLKKITDPFGASVGYTRDRAGRLTGVTGAGFRVVLDSEGSEYTQYASDIKYRAWGAVKHMKYSNNLKLDVSFNARLQISRYSITPQTVVYGHELNDAQEYEYYPDGRVKFISDLGDHKFDRRFFYDHAGRVSQGLSGGEARTGEIDPVGYTRPYRQNYQYDVWDNMTSRSTLHWRESHSYQASYANNRDQHYAMLYDEEGNMTRDASYRQHTYDAAGRKVSAGDHRGSVAHSYDGDGRPLRRAAAPGVDTPSYYIVSSVLGGQTLSEVTTQGQKKVTNVYAEGVLIAKQKVGEVPNIWGRHSQLVEWRHRDPITGSNYSTRWEGIREGLVELDPLGVEAALYDPYEPQADRDWPLMSYGQMSNQGFGCTVDGAPESCSVVMRLVSMGAGAPCPDNDCGPRLRNGRLEPLRLLNVESRGLGMYRTTYDWGSGRMGIIGSYHNPETGEDDPVYEAVSNTEIRYYFAPFAAYFAPQEPAKPSFSPLPCPDMPMRPAEADIKANLKLAVSMKNGTPSTLVGALSALSGSRDGGAAIKSGELFNKYAWFYHQVKTGGPWDYKKLSTYSYRAGNEIKTQFEDFGNFHYGMTGAAAGFDLDQLLRLAGRAQVSDNNPGEGEAAGIIDALLGRGGRAPYGDQQSDADLIKAGYTYFVNNCWKKYFNF
jgi:YD repeat-containing protein